MAAAYPNRTSPVLRGAFILRHIQGVPPATPPSPNCPTLNDKDIGTTKALTVREMMAKHRSSPTCSACHSVMDPLGFALENFDATGMWRDRIASRHGDRSAGELRMHSIKGPDICAGAAAPSDQFGVQTFKPEGAGVCDRPYIGVQTTCLRGAALCVARLPVTTGFHAGPVCGSQRTSSRCAGRLNPHGASK